MILYRWVMDSDSSDEDEGRVVRSEKEKRWEALHEVIEKLRNAVKINDWNKIYQGT